MFSWIEYKNFTESWQDRKKTGFVSSVFLINISLIQGQVTEKKIILRSLLQPSWMYNGLYLKKSYYKQANVQKPLPLKFFIFYVFTYVVMKVVGYNYQSSIHRSVMPASLFPKVTCKSVFWWLAQILLFMISTSQNVLPGTNREAANLIFIPTIRTGSRIILCSISFLSPSLCTWCKFHIQHWIDVRTGNVD